ncbi:MAG: type II toxin-antitoxin system RelE/ParE family toxin [Cyanobacteria bacterium CRU_2_1]|nr:type II toxin-antitoxin system RelE/ParE family toxin [Cyanobacteria bacterium RU_5_0]NJR57379.1 type II toxin-antitoxin system RelE/ParE family toxin [Cyanobacteria bacterium CRU_2_1]
MKVQPKEIQLYLTSDGRVPFIEWLDTLKNIKAQTVINKRLDRVRLGNLGDFKSVGAGVFELRIDFGPGYRVYFGQVGSTLVLLLCGGDKSSQDRDILKAREYWQDYEKRQGTNP